MLTRRCAAAALGLNPADVRVDTEPGGRPILVDANGARLSAHVSITHAGNLVGAVVADLPVGLDVQDVAAFDVLLRSVDIWTPKERRDLALMDHAEQLLTSAQWWTAKEAVLKSLGRGLLDPIETLEARNSPAPWHRLDVGDEHTAAIAGAAPGRILWLRGVNNLIDA